MRRRLTPNDYANRVMVGFGIIVGLTGLGALATWYLR